MVEIDHHRRPTPTTRAVVLLVAMLVCWVVELNIHAEENRFKSRRKDESDMALRTQARCGAIRRTSSAKGIEGVAVR